MEQSTSPQQLLR